MRRTCTGKVIFLSAAVLLKESDRLETISKMLLGKVRKLTL